MFSDILSFNVDPLDYGIDYTIFGWAPVDSYKKMLPIEHSPENGAASATFSPNQRVRKFEEIALLQLRAYEDRMWNEMDPNTASKVKQVEDESRKLQLTLKVDVFSPPVQRRN